MRQRSGPAPSHPSEAAPWEGSCSDEEARAWCGGIKNQERATGKEAISVLSQASCPPQPPRPGASLNTQTGPRASSGPTGVHMGQVRSSLPGARSTVLPCIGVVPHAASRELLCGHPRGPAAVLRPQALALAAPWCPQHSLGREPDHPAQTAQPSPLPLPLAALRPLLGFPSQGTDAQGTDAAH